MIVANERTLQPGENSTEGHCRSSAQRPRRGHPGQGESPPWTAAITRKDCETEARERAPSQGTVHPEPAPKLGQLMRLWPGHEHKYYTQMDAPHPHTRTRTQTHMHVHAHAHGTRHQHLSLDPLCQAHEILFFGAKLRQCPHEEWQIGDRLLWAGGARVLVREQSSRPSRRTH